MSSGDSGFTLKGLMVGLFVCFGVFMECSFYSAVGVFWGGKGLKIQ